MAVKMTRKLSGLLIYSNLKDGSLQQFKGIQRSKQVCQRGTICQQMACKSSRGWTSERSLPVKNFIQYPPSRPGNNYSPPD